MGILNQRVATLPPILYPKQTPVEKKEFACLEGTGSSAHLWKWSRSHTSIVALRRPCNHNLVVTDPTLDIRSFPVVLPQGPSYGNRWIMSSREREKSRSIVMSTVTPTTPLTLNSESPLLPRLKCMSQAISTQGASAVLFLLLPHAQPWLKTTGHSHLHLHLCFPQKGSCIFLACLKPTLSFTHKQSMLHQVFWAPPRLSVQYFKSVPFNALSMLC